MYQDPRVRVITQDGEPKFFEILAGVLLAATMAPTSIFTIVLDFVVQQAVEETGELGFPIDWRSFHWHPKMLPDTSFVDNTVIISEEIEKA